MKQRRLAIITSHPIQYNAPLFKAMNEADSCFTVKVFYTWGQSKEKVFDKEFGLAVDWDIPLLDGYELAFVKNVSSDPGTHHFNGIVNPTLVEEIKDWKADAILVYGWSFSSHLKAIRYFHNKVPVFFRGDSTLLDESQGYSLKKLIRRTFLRWVYSHVDSALYVGTANRKYFLAHGVKPDKLLFAPHAIDNKRFSNDDLGYSQKAANLRLKLGIQEGYIVFLFAAKLTEKKDPEILIKAFLALQAKAVLLIVGNGELEEELKEKYSHFVNILFLNFQNQRMMPVVYRMGDVFVLPSKGPGETWGLAVNEAMACSRAVIVSDKCGCSADLVLQDQNGYIFESGNVDSLVNCMKATLHNYKQLGLSSSQIIRNWNYQTTIGQLQTLMCKMTI